MIGNGINAINAERSVTKVGHRSWRNHQTPWQQHFIGLLPWHQFQGNLALIFINFQPLLRVNIRYFLTFFPKKAKSWALFSLRDPCINFSTEAKQIDRTKEVIVTQILKFGSGVADNTNQTHSLATVCRMTRNIIFPPQFKTLQEWFNYAFANSDIDGKHEGA